MKILYDSQAFVMQDFGGVSNSFCKLIKNLPPDISYEISLEESDNLHLWENGLLQNLKHSKFSFKDFSSYYNGPGANKIYKLLSLTGLYTPVDWKARKKSIELLKKGDFDVFHPTFFDTYFLKHIKKKPFVLTVHDTIFDVYEEQLGYKDKQITNREILCPKAAHIFAVSEHTANDIIKYYNIPEKKISVLYHGAPSQIYRRRELDSIFNFKYILYVGNRDFYKGFWIMLEGLKDLLSISEYKLVCTGKDFTKEECSRIQKMNLTDKIIHFFTTSKDLQKLYNNAELFIYPSEYEGFGIPILEAFACGCPVLLSDASCFPEIGGNAATYFKSKDAQSLYHNANDILNNKELQRNMIERGYKRLQNFSWKQSAEIMADEYRKLL